MTCMSIIHVCLGGTINANADLWRPEGNLKGQSLPSNMAKQGILPLLANSFTGFWEFFPWLPPIYLTADRPGLQTWATTLTEQLLYPQNYLPQPFTASLLSMKPSLKPQPSKLQSHMPTEGTYHSLVSIQPHTNTSPLESLCPALPDTLLCCSDGIWNLELSMT